MKYMQVLLVFVITAGIYATLAKRCILCRRCGPPPCCHHCEHHLHKKRAVSGVVSSFSPDCLHCFPCGPKPPCCTACLSEPIIPEPIEPCVHCLPCGGKGCCNKCLEPLT